LLHAGSRRIRPWRNQIDEITEIRYFSHAREKGKIFWEEAAPDVIQTGLLGKKIKDDVLRLVPVLRCGVPEPCQVSRPIR